MSTATTLLFASGAAFFYMAGSWVMKSHGSSSFAILVPAVFVTFAIGAYFETEVLRVSRLGHVLVLILAIEVSMAFVVAVLILNESYSLREIAAIAIIFGGIALLTMGGKRPPELPLALTGQPVSGP